MDLLSGAMGQPPGGFPKDVQKAILKGRPVVAGRPGATMPPADIEATRKKLTGCSSRSNRSRMRYSPAVSEGVRRVHRACEDLRRCQLPADSLLLLRSDTTEEISVDIETGKRLIIRFLASANLNPMARDRVLRVERSTAGSRSGR